MHEAESPEHLPEPLPPNPADPSAPKGSAEASESPYAVLRNADFIRYLTGRFVASLGQQMLVVAIDWELYERTGSALPLAFVGLSQMIPMILCTLPAGHFADTFSRKKIILITSLLLTVASAGLAVCSAQGWPLIWIYVCLVIIGAARTFLWPASAAFLPGLVPRRQFARAVTYNSGTFQISSVFGPAACGIVIALAHQTAWPVYALNAVASLMCFGLVLQIRYEHKPAERQPVSIKNLVEGFRFVFDNKIILGTITLDLFAVLLGGTVTLLPIYAKDIFHGGPNTLGWLRDAMPIGAVACAVWMAHRRPLQKAGAAMLWSVAIFGVATIAFGVSKLFWFSFAMLAVAGAVDNVSVVVRQTLVQILTPDEKRGRVSAVNSLFINTSNELGGFRSGIVAFLFASPTVLGSAAATGAIVSTVSGGIGTILVVLAVAWIWPQIRKYGKLA
jgi:MFS family permease